MTVPPSSSKTAATCPPAGLATHTCSPGVSSRSSAKADRSHHRIGGTMLVMAVRPFPPLGTTRSCCLRRALAHLLARHGRGEGVPLSSLLHGAVRRILAGRRYRGAGSPCPRLASPPKTSTIAAEHPGPVSPAFSAGLIFEGGPLNPGTGGGAG